MPTRPILVGLAPIALLGGLCAQNSDSRGVLAGSSTVVFVNGGLPSGTLDSTALVHPSGITQPPTREFPPVLSAPNLAAILQMYGVDTTVDVDDISSGRDELLIDQDGFISVPTHLWSVMSFSLTRGAEGAPGSRISREAGTGAVGAALFSYVLPGSNLPTELVGRVERSHSRRDLGIPGDNTTEVDAIDTPMVLGLDQQLTTVGNQIVSEPNWGPLLGTPQFLFFTFSNSTLALVPAAWWGGTIPSGATIFWTMRTSFSSFWTAPTIWRTYDQLGLMSTEDVDALAIEYLADVNAKILYSTKGTARDQFLFHDTSTDGVVIPKEVKKPDGTKLSESVGKLQGDDVDAVCTLDPQLNDVGEMSPGGDDFGSTVGIPRPGILGVPEIDGSAWRRYEGGQIRFDSFMTGWPESTGPAPGFSFCFVTFGDAFDLVPIGGAHLRDPLDVIPGNPQSESLLVPPGLALTGTRITFRWLHIDGTAFSLHEVRPVQVFL